MRIASFNVENLREVPDTGSSLEHRFEILRPQFERLDADILCLQEVDAGKDPQTGHRRMHALEELRATTSYRGFELVSTVNPQTRRPRDRHNLAILSRWPVRSVRQYANDLVDPPLFRTRTSEPAASEPEEIRFDRAILHAEIAHPSGRVLHVVNLHLKAPLAAAIAGQKLAPFVWKSVPGWAEGYYVASIKRNGQALEARLLLDRIFDEDPSALVVVSGDFNAEEREVPLRILIAEPEDTGNGRLASRSLVLLEHGLADSKRYTVIHGGHRQMLDHFLVSRPMLAHFRSMEIHNEALGDELIAYAIVDASAESYHAPIVAEFDFDESESG